MSMKWMTAWGRREEGGSRTCRPSLGGTGCSPADGTTRTRAEKRRRGEGRDQADQEKRPYCSRDSGPGRKEEQANVS